ncbi:MAG: DNA-3-methyladenine glycosylase 2 family protein [Amphritea sp.]|nr:DNA-3-methyladenine glycosylase 2 family protein [Amphritea sp.]
MAIDHYPPLDQQQIDHALQQLALQDDDVARGLALVGTPPPRIRPSGFPTLLSIVISQQLATSAAAAIRERVEGLLGEVTPQRFLDADDQALRDVGLSWRKIEYGNGLARAIDEETLDLQKLRELSDNEAIKAITALRGFGRWSAEIYLMFSLNRPDVFPADDLALLVALQRLKDLDEKPTPKQARELIEHWAPWRSAGSLFLWQT